MAARGILAVAFGVATVLVLEQTLVMLVSLFGVFALANGFFTIGALYYGVGVLDRGSGTPGAPTRRVTTPHDRDPGEPARC